MPVFWGGKYFRWFHPLTTHLLTLFLHPLLHHFGEANNVWRLQLSNLYLSQKTSLCACAHSSHIPHTQADSGLLDSQGYIHIVLLKYPNYKIELM